MMTSRTSLSRMAWALGGAATLALCAGVAQARSHGNGERIEVELAKGQVDEAIRDGEQAVAEAPHDAGRSALLGRAYLKAGRFESAAALLQNAYGQGDTSGRTVLSLALAKVALGHGAEAQQLLDSAQGSLSVSDFGLALALAGDTGRGIAVLSDALRSGQGNEKLRQNLAYAFALDGRWAEARVMVIMDLRGDQVDQRLTQWASQARPEAYRQRVAMLLGVPVRADAGVPTTLAASLGVPAAPAPSALALAAAPQTELPAVEAGAGAATPAPAPAEPAAPPPAAPPVFAEVAPSPQPMMAPPAVHAIIPAAFVAHAPLRARAVPAHAPLARAAPRVDGTHMVQLGAFSTAQNAQRAKAQFLSRNPGLRGHGVQITQAQVNGRNFWRVAAQGFDQASASSACDHVRHGGGVCFAYTATHAPALGGELAMATPLRAPRAR